MSPLRPCQTCGEWISTGSAQCPSCGTPEPFASPDVQASEGPGPVRERVGGLLRAAQSRAGEAFQDGQDVLLRQARALRERTEALNRPEDPEAVLGSSSLFRPFPAAGLPPELTSLAWRGDALLGLSACGVLAFEDEISRTTRHLFHDSTPHQELSFRLFGADFDAIHGYMDTVPGSAHRGGGILHRLQHGHDLEGAQAIYDEHGLPGLLVWTQHMAQDATTPTGVPIPVGGPRLASWLVDEGIASPGKAALLVSFNIAELAAAFLAGAFVLRLGALLPEIQRRRKVRKRLERAAVARAAGDLDAVIAHYEEARSLGRDRQPGVNLALGWAYAAAERPMAESFLAFRSAAEGLAVDDHAVEVDGVTLSLRGIAYLMALSQGIQVLEFEDMRGAWRGELTRLARGGLASFESLAIAQDERLALEVGERRLQLRPRPLSAAANYYLAARTAVAVPFLSVASETGRLRERALELLTRAEIVHASAAAIPRVGERWSAELAHMGLLAPAS